MSASPALSFGKVWTLCCVAASLLGIFSGSAAEWTQYRGPNHDAISAERINKQWSGSVTNPVWLVYLTNGLTSLTVSDGRVFTQVGSDTDGDGYPDKEFCVALSTTNGSVLWSTEVEAADSPLYPNGGVGISDDGPRTTPTVDGGSVYVLSSYLKLHRLNATNGAVIWSTNLLTAFGGSVIPWQNAASPLLENGLLFVNANCGSSNLMAFNATNGALVWRSQSEPMTQATPVLATIHGVRHLIFASQSGLVALDPETGGRLWKFNYPFAYNTALASSPAVHQDMIFISGQYSMGAVAVQIVQSNATLVPVQRWRNTNLRSHWSTPVCYNGALFGQFEPDTANAQLRCFNMFTGTTNWSVSNFGRGSTMLVGTNLLVITERGDLVLAVAKTNDYTELGRFQAIPNFNTDLNKCWNALALSDGQLYVRSTAYAARFDLSVPDLMLDAPQFVPDNKLQLTIRTVTGTPLDSNRLTAMEVRASTDVALTPSLWTALTNDLLLTNGVVTVPNLDAGPPQRFFIVTEPE